MAVSVHLAPGDLAVEPGGTATTTAVVTNLSAIVEEVIVEVLGDVAPWVRVEPAIVKLFPGDTSEVAVVATCPTTSEIAPGPHPFALRARASVDPSAVSVEESVVVVGGVSAVEVELHPITSTGRSGRHEVILSNHGNAPARVDLEAEPTDTDLDLRLEPAQLHVPPGGTATALLVVHSPDKETARHGFRVTASPAAGAPAAVDGAISVRRRSRLPFLITSAALILLVAAVVTARNENKAKVVALGPESSTTAGPASTTTTVGGGPTTTTGGGDTTTSRGVTPGPASTTTPRPSPPPPPPRPTPPPVPPRIIGFGTASSTSGADNEIWSYDAGGGDRRNLSNLPGVDRTPRASASHARIVWTHIEAADGSRDSLWVADGTGAGRRRLLDDPGLTYAWPDLSPDGSTLAWSQAAPGSTTACQVYTRAVDGGTPRLVDDGQGRCAFYPRFSPDGRRVAYYTHSGFTGQRLFVANADGSGRVELGPGIDPTWGPDGTIVYAEGARLWRVPSTGGARVPVGSMSDALTPELSPDGRSLTWFHIEVGTGRWELWQADASGAGARRLAQDVWPTAFS